MKNNNKGQAAAYDVIMMFFCIMIFTLGVWALTLGNKAGDSQAQRTLQDYTKSMLLSILYATPERPGSTDLRYVGKSVSDLIGMRYGNPDKVSEEMLLKKIKNLNIGTQIKQKGGDKAEWYLYSEDKDDPSGRRKICLHGVGDKEPEKCPDGDIYYKGTAASAEIVYPVDSSGGTATNVATANEFKTVKIYLIIKWN
jgi:hypothetical protein